VVSAMDPYSRILGFLDRTESYYQFYVKFVLRFVYSWGTEWKSESFKHFCMLCIQISELNALPESNGRTHVTQFKIIVSPLRDG
jgi:hypothetical protein